MLLQKLKAPPSSFDGLSKGVGVNGCQALSSCQFLKFGFAELNASLKTEYEKKLFFFAKQLGEKTGKAEELWGSVEKSYQSLVKRLHCGTANALGEQMEEERKRLVA